MMMIIATTISIIIITINIDYIIISVIILKK